MSSHLQRLLNPVPSFLHFIISHNLFLSSLKHLCSSFKIDGSGKKRKCDNGPQSESSQAASALGESPTKRPPGVKASKAASGKRSIADQEASKAASAEFLAMCSIKERDLAVKERDLAVQESVKKMDLLDRLIAKPEPLSESEEALKQKLITEMLSK